MNKVQVQLCFALDVLICVLVKRLLLQLQTKKSQSKYKASVVSKDAKKIKQSVLWILTLHKINILHFSSN